MQQFLRWLHGLAKKRSLLFFVIAITGFTGCQKGPGLPIGLPASLYSADVIDKWMTLEIRIYKDATGIGNGAFARPFAYSGISAYESIDPGLFSWKNKYNGLSGLPETEKSKKYNWAASVNASLAEFNRSFFTTSNLNATDLAAIDSLENAISSLDSAVTIRKPSAVPLLSASRLPTLFLPGDRRIVIFRIMPCPIRRR